MDETLAYAVQNESLVLSEGHITEEEKKQLAESVTQASEWRPKSREA